jgi:hypothetical protein
MHPAMSQDQRLLRLVQSAAVGDERAKAGRETAGLRLFALGRIRDAVGEDLFTVWAVRNSTERSRSVTLYAPQVTGRLDTSFRLEFTLPPKTEAVVHSHVTAWPATHLLSEGVRLIAVSDASQSAYPRAPEAAASALAAQDAPAVD